MGRYLFRLPDIGEGVAEAEIVAWYVKVGDRVTEDQGLVDVMTDKATVDMTSPVEGRVVAIRGEVGTMTPVGAVLVEIEIEGAGEDGAADKDGDAQASAPPANADAAGNEAAHRSAPPIASRDESGRPAALRPRDDAARAHKESVLAAPSTRRRAGQLGVALDLVHGTGRGGRITAEDVQTFAAGGEGAAHAQARPAADSITETRIIGLRRRIAEKMQEAKRRIPHIGYVEDCDLTELEALREELNAHRSEGMAKLSLLPFFMRALARVLPAFPQINAHYDDEAGVLRAHSAVHIGIATQTPEGLKVPVVRHVERLDLWACASEVARVADAARTGTATREELSGSTITLTSLGPLGGIASTPVINHPEVAILAPNKLKPRPILLNGFVTVRKMMNLSSSYDHRIVDGYDAARFVQAIKRLLEHPALLFMEHR